MPTDATKKQINYILDLATRLTGRTAHSLYDIRALITGSHRHLSFADASATIDDLKAQLADKEAAQPAPPPTTADQTPAVTSDTGMDPATAVSLLGKQVTLTSDSGKTITGWVQNISLRDGEPALYIFGARVGHWLLRRTVSWSQV